jgi:4-aminobutyrate aminotransferase/(S)-3-amino-2-methylpropionate transaminase
MKSIEIAGREIGLSHPPFIIAEMSGNHNQSLERALEIETVLLSRLGELKSQYPVIGDLRGKGAMIAIELVEPGTKTPSAAAVDSLVKHCHSNGVLILNAGTYNNVIRFLPPLAITDELLHDAMDVLAAGLAKL